jgi:hypothetical protein
MRKAFSYLKKYGSLKLYKALQRGAAYVGLSEVEKINSDRYRVAVAGTAGARAEVDRRYGVSLEVRRRLHDSDAEQAELQRQR